MGRLLIIVAGGYQAYDNEAKEKKALAEGNWSPQTKDFVATANLTSRRVKALTAKVSSQFLGAFTTGKGKIRRVIFIGHGSKGQLLLGTTRNILGPYPEILDRAFLTLESTQRIIEKRIKPRLHKNATIDLIACNVAVGAQFMQTIANVFGVKVRGFSTPVYWCLDPNMIRGWISLRRDCKRKHRGVLRIKFHKVFRPNKIPRK